ncbi:Origin recognition complex subunit 5 [Entophlyctis luteolus]|nr:Origin recognition complex subunit 5 [Entophlyctis luteolus]KAJ3350301.1 Origin recognition complex subunit 5 [Entophlyctis luteolus]
MQTVIPARSPQLRLLESVVRMQIAAENTRGACVSAVYILVARAVFEPLAERAALVDCIRAFTPGLLFDTALCAFFPDPDLRANLPRCENAAEFVSSLRELLLPNPDSNRTDRAAARFLVIDHSEKLRGTGLVPVLLRLAELTNANITVILISNLPWHKFKESAESTEPIFIYFPTYTESETKEILALDCPADEKDDPQCFHNFIDLTLTVLNTPCRDLNELRHIVALLYPKYIEPIKAGKMSKADSNKLYQNIKFYFKEVIDKLYTRKISTSEWTNTSSASAMRFSNSLADGCCTVDMDLPYNTVLLLLASFIASYNPKGLDMRFFARASEKRVRKGAGGLRRTSTKLRQQLLGPKAFPLERMLAIFYRIKEDTRVEAEMESLVDIQMQVSSLVSKGLLLRIGNAGRIDEVKCKVNIGLEMAYGLAARLRFDLGKYLHDFKT